MYLGVTAAAEPCSACLTRRALQGQYILSAPYCQLSPSQLHRRVAPQTLQGPASSVSLPFLWDSRAATLNLPLVSLPAPCCVLTSPPAPLLRISFPLRAVLLRYKPRQFQVAGQTSLPRRRTGGFGQASQRGGGLAGAGAQRSPRVAGRLLAEHQRLGELPPFNR